jgi:hypothetical protein
MLETADEPLLSISGVKGVEEVGATLKVGSLASNHVINNDENGMGNSDSGFLGPATATDAVILFTEISFGTPGGMSSLDESRAQVAVGGRQFGGELFGAALLLTRSDTSPGGQVVSGGKNGHIDANLADDNTSQGAIDTRDVI